MFNYLRLPLFRKYHVGGWFFFAFFGEKNKAIQLDLKKNPTPQKLYFSANIRKEKLDANVAACLRSYKKTERSEKFFYNFANTELYDV
jgi:hypothetical protein